MKTLSKFLLLFTLALTLNAASWQKVSLSSGLPPVTAGLVAEYKFDSSNANDTAGTYQGVPTNITYAAGRFGVSSLFNGSNSVISAPSIDTSGTFSISGWVKPATATYFIGSATAGSDGKMYAGWSGGNFIFGGNGGGSTSISGTSAPLLNTWNHFVLIKDGGIASVYINNGLVCSGPVSILTSSTTLRFGNVTFYWLNGGMDNIRIYNRALTASEVTSLFNETPY